MQRSTGRPPARRFGSAPQPTPPTPAYTATETKRHQVLESETILSRRSELRKSLISMWPTWRPSRWTGVSPLTPPLRLNGHRITKYLSCEDSDTKMFQIKGWRAAIGRRVRELYHHDENLRRIEEAHESMYKRNHRYFLQLLCVGPFQRPSLRPLPVRCELLRAPRRSPLHLFTEMERRGRLLERRPLRSQWCRPPVPRLPRRRRSLLRPPPLWRRPSRLLPPRPLWRRRWRPLFPPPLWRRRSRSPPCLFTETRRQWSSPQARFITTFVHLRTCYFRSIPSRAESSLRRPLFVVSARRNSGSV